MNFLMSDSSREAEHLYVSLLGSQASSIFPVEGMIPNEWIVLISPV